LLQKLRDEYSECSSHDARLRALQRDLKQLLDDEAIVSGREPGEGKTLRYKRAAHEAITFDNSNLRELQANLQQLGLPARLIDDILRRVRAPDSFFDLPSSQFITVPDTVQLAPKKATHPDLQGEIIKALRHKCVLKAVYRSASDEEARERRLHLVGLIRRGAQFYFVAYDEKNLAEPQPPAKLYKLQRLEDALALEGETARPLAEPTLEMLVVKYRIAEFAHDTKPVMMKLRVWDYVRDLLEENTLSPDQITSPDPEDEDAALVSATVIQSGTLYRWLLGLGDKLEVLEPPGLRNAIAGQAANE
jgi:predicted DNA-binding transcriptional regulator YafY